MPVIKYKVELADSQRSYLLEVARRGRSSARKVKRALVLLKADEGLADHEVASGLLVSTSTVGRIRRRFVEEGVESALNERARPGQKRKLDGKQEAHIVAIACSQAPEGHSHWTLQLLANKVVEMEFADAISLETVRQMLKKTNSNHGPERNGVFQRELYTILRKPLPMHSRNTVPRGPERRDSSPRTYRPHIGIPTSS